MRVACHSLFYSFLKEVVCILKHLLFLTRSELPAVVTVVDHLPCHAAIDADVLSGDETGLVAAEEQHHIGNVHWVANSAAGLLGGIGTFVNDAGGVNPTG